MLLLFARLVLNVALPLQMIIRRCPVIGARTMPADLLREASDIGQETETVATGDDHHIDHPIIITTAGDSLTQSGDILPARSGEDKSRAHRSAHRRVYSPASYNPGNRCTILSAR